LKPKQFKQNTNYYDEVMNKNKSILDKYKNKKTLHTSLFEVQEIIEEIKQPIIKNSDSPNKSQ